MTATTTRRTLMETDMGEQPDVLRRLIEDRSSVHALVRRIVPTPLRGVALVGRGSSGNAALYGRILIELRAGIPVTLIPPSMVRLYTPTTDEQGVLAIGLSQSGRTREIVDSLASLRSRGAVTLGLTAHASSPIAEVCDAVVDLGTRRERAVPATKSFLGEIAAIAMIAEALASRYEPAVSWRRAHAAVASALRDELSARSAAAIADASELSVIASGLLVPVAHEAALKVVEAARLPADGWSSEAFLHGPMTLAGPRHPVVVIAVHELMHPELARTTALLRTAPLITIADRADADLPFEGGLPEELAAFPATIRAQQLALQLALRRGVDPDHPPRLRKVTAS